MIRKSKDAQLEDLRRQLNKKVLESIAAVKQLGGNLAQIQKEIAKLEKQIHALGKWTVPGSARGTGGKRSSSVK